MNLDVTGKVKPGKNVIAIRVWNNAEIGGLFRRGFLWSPKAISPGGERRRRAVPRASVMPLTSMR